MLDTICAAWTEKILKSKFRQTNSTICLHHSYGQLSNEVNINRDRARPCEQLLGLVMRKRSMSFEDAALITGKICNLVVSIDCQSCLDHV